MYIPVSFIWWIPCGQNNWYESDKYILYLNCAFKTRWIGVHLLHFFNAYKYKSIPYDENMPLFPHHKSVYFIIWYYDSILHNPSYPAILASYNLPLPDNEKRFSCELFLIIQFVLVLQRCRYFDILHFRTWYEDAIKWKHFPHYWPFVRGFHRSPVNSPHKGQRRGALMFSFICARTMVE